MYITSQMKIDLLEKRKGKERKNNCHFWGKKSVKKNIDQWQSGLGLLSYDWMDTWSVYNTVGPGRFTTHNHRKDYSVFSTEQSERDFGRVYNTIFHNDQMYLSQRESHCLSTMLIIERWLSVAVCSFSHNRENNVCACMKVWPVKLIHSVSDIGRSGRKSQGVFLIETIRKTFRFQMCSHCLTHIIWHNILCGRE